MRAKINGIEIEATLDELVKLITELEKNKKPQPPATTFPPYPTYEYYPPTYVTPTPSTLPLNPFTHPQVWCGGYSGSGSVTCKQNPFSVVCN